MKDIKAKSKMADRLLSFMPFSAYCNGVKLDKCASFDICNGVAETYKTVDGEYVFCSENNEIQRDVHVGVITTEMDV